MRSERARCVLLAVVLLPAPAAPAPQESGSPAGIEGRVVEAIRWRGLRALVEQTVAFYLGVETGRPLDPEALNRGLHRLWQTGLVDDVQVDARETATGVELEVRIEERPLLSAIRVDGLDPLLRAEIEREILSTAEIGVDPRPIPAAELERLRSEIEDLVERRSRVFAAASYRLVEARPGEVEAIFGVETAARVRLAAIDFQGNEALSDARLRRAMRRNRQSGLMAGMLSLGSWDPEGLEEDLELVFAVYRERGFKDAAVGEPRTEPAGEGRGLSLTLTVEEGMRWRMGGVSVEGNRAFSDQRLLSLFERPRGPWLDEAAVEAWLEAMAALYRSDGRLETEISRELRERPDGTVDVFVRVEEGERLALRRLAIEGNTRTRDRVLRRELAVEEGEVLNLSALESALARVERLRIFDLDDEPIELRGVEPGTVDVTIRGREAKTFETSFGGGWGEADGASVHAALETRNLLGRGHGAGVRLQIGELRDRFELFYTVPWLLDRPQLAGGRLFLREGGFTLAADQRFERREAGGTVGWSRSSGRFRTLWLSYTRADLEDLQERTGDAGETVRRQLSLGHSALEAAWVFDSRDHPLTPRRGVRFRASLEAAGGLLGGDQSFVRPEASFSLFRRMRRAPVPVHLALRLEAGALESSSDEPPSPLEAFYLGGSRGPRGFATRSLSVRGDDDELVTDAFGFLVGGSRFLTSGVEIEVPLAGPVSAAVFFDAGNVYGDDSLDLSRLRTTAGAELRIHWPKLGIPLRLIWAENLDPLPGDRFDSFLFRFGGSF